MIAGVLSTDTLPQPTPERAETWPESRSERIDLTWKGELSRALRSLQWTSHHRRLAALPLFAACSRSEIRTLARWGDQVDVDAGRVLLRENAIGYHFVVVVSGRLALTRSGRLVGTLGPGGHVGDVAILGLGPQPNTLTTLTPCRLFVLGRVALLSLAPYAAGVRQGLFPGLGQAEAVLEIRRMRTEGLAAWPRRPRMRATELAVPFAPPPSLRWNPRSTPTARSGSCARVARPSIAPPPAAPVTPARRALRALVVASVMIVVLAGVALTARPPIAVITPGHPIDVAADLSITGAATQPIHGHYILTSVRIDQPNYAEWMLARVDGETTAPLASDQPTAARVARQAFAQGQASAVQAAASATGIDPTTIRVEFRHHDVSGPSASLIYAITLADLLDPADLAAGRTIAATGELDNTGHIHGVGFVKEKAAVARAAGATLLLVPPGQDPGDTGINVIEVATLDDALAALRSP